MKWLVVAGLALVPATAVLSGCGGGSGSAFNLGAGAGKNQANQFAGVQGDGPLLRDGVNVGTVNFAVNDNGVINGTVNVLPAQAQVVRKNATRAATTASSNVAADGSFSLVFNNVLLNGRTQTLTFSGKISRSGSTASVASVQVTSSVAGGAFGLDLSVSIAGSGGSGTANGTFNVSGGNSSGGSLTSNAGVAIATRANGKIVSLAISFTEAGTSGARSVTVFVNNFTEVKVGSYDIAAGDASATYTEVPTANPQAAKSFISDTGTVKVDSISATQVKVTLTNAKLTGLPGGAGTGTVTVFGSGTGTIQ